MLAVNSVPSKKEERLEDAIDNYYSFVDSYSSSDHIKECEQMYDDIVKAKENFQLTNK